MVIREENLGMAMLAVHLAAAQAREVPLGALEPARAATVETTTTQA